MARRDDNDARPPIEIVGAEPLTESLERVSVSPGSRRRSTRRALAVCAGVAILLIGGLTLGDDDPDTTGDTPAEERDNSAKLPLKGSTTTEPRTTTTRPPTTTTTIPVGPVFGEPVGAGLIVYSSAAWQLIDLDTGARTDLDLPTRSSYGEVAVRGGIVMINRGGTREAEFYSISRSGEVGPPVVLGLADQVLPAGRPDRLWLIDGGGRSSGDGGFTSSTADVRLVDLTGEAVRSFRVPSAYVSRAVDEGVLLDRGGRVYLADEAGIRPIAVGWTVGVMGDDVLLISCDDEAVCALTRQAVDGGATRALIDRIDVDRIGFDAISADDGRIALMSYGEDGQSLLLFDAAGRSLGTLEGGATGFNEMPRWLPGDRGMLYVAGSTGHWIRSADGEWVSEPIPGLEGISSEVALVISW